jgi:hypothetical protein
MNGLTEKIPSQTPRVITDHQTVTSTQKIYPLRFLGECDSKGAEAVMEIWTQQTW